MSGDVVRLPEPGEDLADLRAVTPGVDFGGEEDRDHVMFGCWFQQAHPLSVESRPQDPVPVLALVIRAAGCADRFGDLKECS
jgi:hypothetical protein